MKENIRYKHFFSTFVLFRKTLRELKTFNMTRTCSHWDALKPQNLFQNEKKTRKKGKAATTKENKIITRLKF